LDDIGAESNNDWIRDNILQVILQYRMQENLPTFFTSNLTMDELEMRLAMTKKGMKLGLLSGSWNVFASYQESFAWRRKSSQWSMTQSIS
jgi:DNA replication protein DnaC